MKKARRPRRQSEYAKSRTAIRRHYKAYSIHHMYPRSRDGSDKKYNLFPWDDKHHNAWHKVFRHMTIREIWETFDTVWSSLFQTQDEKVLPSWWKVCPFSFQERHIPHTLVDVVYLREAWFECFDTTELEKSRGLVRLMLAFYVFDGDLYDQKRGGDLASDKNLKRLRLTTSRIRVDTPRHWAFTVCFDEEPSSDPDQAVRVAKTIKHIFRDSPYTP